MTTQTAEKATHDNIEKTERNARMLLDLQRGKSRAEVARNNGITRQRVNQFVRRWKAAGLLD